jgi:hypothetical protein
LSFGTTGCLVRNALSMNGEVESKVIERPAKDNAGNDK